LIILSIDSHLLGAYLFRYKISGFIEAPFTLNAYSYCWNDPLNLLDLNGLWPQWARDLGNGVRDAWNNATSTARDVVRNVVDWYNDLPIWGQIAGVVVIGAITVGVAVLAAPAAAVTAKIAGIATGAYTAGVVINAGVQVVGDMRHNRMGFREAVSNISWLESSIQGIAAVTSAFVPGGSILISGSLNMGINMGAYSLTQIVNDEPINIRRLLIEAGVGFGFGAGTELLDNIRHLIPGPFRYTGRVQKRTESGVRHVLRILGIPTRTVREAFRQGGRTVPAAIGGGALNFIFNNECDDDDSPQLPPHELIDPYIGAV